MNRRWTTFGIIGVFCWGFVAGIWLARWSVESGHSPHIAPKCIPTKDSP